VPGQLLVPIPGGHLRDLGHPGHLALGPALTRQVAPDVDAGSHQDLGAVAKLWRCRGETKVVTNLVVNTSRFSPEGPQIHVRVEEDGGRRK